MARAFDWLSQAQNDLSAVELMMSSSYYSQACFLSQQSAEKALKAIAFSRGISVVKSHSTRQIAHDLGINGDIEEAGRELDIYYISARYPDGLPEGAPFQAFSLAQAKSAHSAAELIVNFATKELNIMKVLKTGCLETYLSNNRRISKEEALSALKEIGAGFPGQIYLFGSTARNSANENSDVDIILITETSEPFVTRPLKYSMFYDKFPKLDLLVYTPKEFESLRAKDGFWSEIQKDLIRVQ